MSGIGADTLLYQIVRPDQVGILALHYANASPDPVVIPCAQDVAARFESLLKHYPSTSAEGLYLEHYRCCAYAAALIIRDIDSDTERAISYAGADYERLLFGSSQSQAALAIGRWCIKILLLMGAGYSLTQLGMVLIQLPGHTDWLPWAVMVAVPLLIGVGQSIWRTFAVTQQVYRRDCRIHQVRSQQLETYRRAILYAERQTHIAWHALLGAAVLKQPQFPLSDLIETMLIQTNRQAINPPLHKIISNHLTRGFSRYRKLSSLLITKKG